MVRDAIGAPDLGNVACECALTSTAADAGPAPTEWWVSTHLMTHMERRLPHTRRRRVTSRFATSPDTSLQMRAPLRCTSLRAIPMSTRVQTRLATCMYTYLQQQQVKPCSKRMYTHILLQRSMRMTMYLVWRKTRPLEYPKLTRMGLRVTQSEDMQLEQRGSTRGAPRLNVHLDWPCNGHSLQCGFMRGGIRIASTGGTHIATGKAMYAAGPLVERLPTRVCRSSRSDMYSRMRWHVATRSGLPV
jgi:hypothetical protein